MRLEVAICAERFSVLAKSINTCVRVIGFTQKGDPDDDQACNTPTL